MHFKADFRDRKVNKNFSIAKHFYKKINSFRQIK